MRMLVIEGMGARGEAVAETGAGRVFVPYALPGESVRAFVDGQRAEIDEIVTPSLDRIAPFCPHFGRCGGCQLQHWAEAPYRDWKRGLVVSALERAGIAVPVGALIDAHGAGRRRVTLRATPQGAGFTAWKSHELEIFETCPILAPDLRAAPEIAHAASRQLGSNAEALLTASATGIDLALVAKTGHKPDFAALAQRFDLARVALNGEVLILRRQPVVTIGAARLDLPVAPFLQPTLAGEEALSALVSEALEPARRVADLFAGAGTFALRLASASQVYAVDSDARAIAACDRALQATPGLRRIGTEVRDLFRDPLTARELERFDGLVFDPPRAGAEAQVREIAKSKIRRVVAVSCDPVTFARDAEILVGAGYRLHAATPVDQFRFTAHVECVGVFRR
ncbi:MAG: methyltransferase [Alphaproteobacteria bacterium]|nr:methyltransferase [Alphaproteobacteria bacterium]